MLRLELSSWFNRHIDDESSDTAPAKAKKVVLTKKKSSIASSTTQKTDSESSSSDSSDSDNETVTTKSKAIATTQKKKDASKDHFSSSLSSSDSDSSSSDESDAKKTVKKVTTATKDAKKAPLSSSSSSSGSDSDSDNKRAVSKHAPMAATVEPCIEDRQVAKRRRTNDEGNSVVTAFTANLPDNESASARVRGPNGKPGRQVNERFKRVDASKIIPIQDNNYVAKVLLLNRYLYNLKFSSITFSFFLFSRMPHKMTMGSARTRTSLLHVAQASVKRRTRKKEEAIGEARFR